ncbi:platelet binding protein-related, partial [Schistosoma japonicum]
NIVLFCLIFQIISLTSYQHSESIQKIRLFKEGHMRHAIVTFVDIKSATAVINAENKLNDSLLKMEYCSSSDNITVGIINHKSINSHRNNNAEISNQLSTFNNTNNNNNNNLDRKTEK